MTLGVRYDLITPPAERDNRQSDFIPGSGGIAIAGQNGVPSGILDTRKHDFKLEPGLTLAVEPMVNMGRGDVDTLSDHWTVVTRDRLPSVHVEHTLALTAEGVMIVTADEGAYPPDEAPAGVGVPAPPAV